METFLIIEKILNIKIDNVMVMDAIERKPDRLADLQRVLDTGALCTGCVSKYLNFGNNLNSTVPFPNATVIIKERCGAHFGSELVCLAF